MAEVPDAVCVDLVPLRGTELLLQSPAQWHLAKSDIEFEPIRVSIGDRPFGVDLESLYAKSGRALKADAIFEKFAVWLVTYTVGVIKEGAGRPLQRLGLCIEYDPNQNVRIIELLPQSKFVKRMGGTLACDFDLGIDGHARIPSQLVPGLTSIPLAELIGNLLPIRAKMSFATQAELVGRLSFGVVTPIIQAVGVASSSSEWVIESDDEPLLGDHIFQQVLLVPRRKVKSKSPFELNATVTLKGVIGGYFRVPVPLIAEPRKLICSLLP